MRIDDPSAAPASRPAPLAAGRDHLNLLAGLGLALLMHGTLLYALTRQERENGPAGAGGVELEAISVEVALVPARALESRADPAAPAAETGTLSPIEGLPEPVPDQLREKADKQQKDQTSAPPQEETAVQIVEPQENPAKDSEKRIEKRDEPVPDQPSPVEAGGTITHADVADRKAVQGAAMASPGVVRDYASRVMIALGKNKPKGAGVRGTVEISFAVRTDGTLDFVRILKSSGSERLDSVAITAVRHASLPPPPAGMSALQRTFVLPYQFR